MYSRSFRVHNVDTLEARVRCENTVFWANLLCVSGLEEERHWFPCETARYLSKFCKISSPSLPWGKGIK
jgi:hypothetical protein